MWYKHWSHYSPWLFRFGQVEFVVVVVVVRAQGCIHGLWAVNTNGAVRFWLREGSGCGFPEGSERKVGMSAIEEVPPLEGACCDKPGSLSWNSVLLQEVAVSYAICHILLLFWKNSTGSGRRRKRRLHVSSYLVSSLLLFSIGRIGCQILMGAFFFKACLFRFQVYSFLSVCFLHRSVTGWLAVSLQNSSLWVSKMAKSLTERHSLPSQSQKPWRGSFHTMLTRRITEL